MRTRCKKILLYLLSAILILEAVPMTTFAADSNVQTTEVTEGLTLSFNSEYAKPGEAMTVTCQNDGAELTSGVTYSWSVGTPVEWNSESTSYFKYTKVTGNTSNSYTPSTSDLGKMIKVEATYGSSTIEATMFCSKLPVTYIDTNGVAITSKENYIDGTMTMQGNDEFQNEKELYSGAIEIRGRGNSTWSMAKKPYRIKLDKKCDVLGMGDGEKNKHWVLLANYADESLMRNTLGYRFSGELGMPYMSTEWVDVVLNGRYVGTYQFCENIRTAEDRVDVFDWESYTEDLAAVMAEETGVEELESYMVEEDANWITQGENGTVTYNGTTYKLSDYQDAIFAELEIDEFQTDISGGYILELDSYTDSSGELDEVSNFYTDGAQPIKFKNPEYAVASDDMMEYVKSYVQAFEDAVRSDDYTAEFQGESKHYSELFDFEALVDYWLINEIFFNIEVNKKSTYMYKEIGELMKMGPIWDLDWSSGGEGTYTDMTEAWATNRGESAQYSQWYKDLVSDPYFLIKAQERYWEIRDIVADMVADIDVYEEYLSTSAAANDSVWQKTSSGYEPFDENVSELKAWFNAHITWLDAQFATEDSVFEKLNSDNIIDGKYYEYGYNQDTSVGLSVTDTSGKALEADTITDVSQAPADAVLASGDALTVNVTYGAMKELTVYVNGKSVGTVNLSNNTGSYTVSAEALTADVGEKNIIEVKGIGSDNKVHTNYITVLEVEGDVIECEHEKQVTVVTPADASENVDGSIVVRCEDCNKVISTEAIPFVQQCKLKDAPEGNAYAYTGEAIQPEVWIADGNGKEISSEYYTLTYDTDCVTPGWHSIELVYQGHHAGSMTFYYEIVCEHTYDAGMQPATPEKDGVIYSDACTQCGVANEGSTSSVIYRIDGVSLSATTLVYSGQEQVPTVTVKDSQGTVISAEYYTVQYPESSSAVGTYNITVTFKGNYEGQLSAAYSIQCACSTTKTDITKATTKQDGRSVTTCVTCGKEVESKVIASIASVKLSATSYTYNGKTRKPSVTVKDSNGKTISSQYYTVSYSSGRKKVGTYTVTIKMSGLYSGTIKKTFKILPKATSLVGRTAGSKSLTVKWKKQSKEVTGYQIKYSTSSKFTKATTKTISSSTKVSYKLKGLKGKKTYYVKIRTYKTVKVNGKSTKFYSSWSKAKKMTTKK